MDAAERRVLDAWIDSGGRLKGFPARRKKFLVVLRWLVEDFQPGIRYPEGELNRILGRRHPDFATLRRRLVDEELMRRRAGVYWRTGSVVDLGHDPSGWPGAAGTQERAELADLS